MRAATLFSGIGAPEQARPDWQWLWHAEIEKFPAAVLAARHPGSVNLGDVSADDFAERAERVGRPDVLVFGSPCQSFSVAGKRLGLSDPRGNLALVALALVSRLRPRWFIFENVPGLLSSEGGDDFAAFLGTVAECGYSGCWRVLDARYWNLAQRRERVFFVGSLGDWRGPAAVLSLTEGLRGYPEKGSQARERVADTLTVGANQCSAFKGDFVEASVSMCLNAHPNRCDAESETLIAHTLRADGFDASEDGTGRGTPLVPVAFMDTESHSSGNNVDIAPTMRTGDCAKISVAHAFNWQSGGDARGLELRDQTSALSRQQTPAVLNTAVRRLTPTECERLQGFPDGHTAIQWRGKPAADGPRYKALGNSMAVPVLRWLLTRIEAHDAALRAAA
jgi:DNA (cytosine-5)-methyltransferase 1